MTTFKHAMQLVQLQRLDPPAAAKAELLHKSGFWSEARKVIVKAMKRALARQSAKQNETPSMWGKVLEAIETGNLPPEGKQMKLTQATTLFHRRDGYIVLRNGNGLSRPIARWGRDWDRLSSAFAGKWKLTDEAQRNFEAWYVS